MCPALPGVNSPKNETEDLIKRLQSLEMDTSVCPIFCFPVGITSVGDLVEPPLAIHPFCGQNHDLNHSGARR
jgi:hypothetical protein